MKTPNPFARAFSAKDAHIFEAEIAAYMCKAVRAEGHRPGLPPSLNVKYFAPTGGLSAGQSRVLAILIAHGPMTTAQLAEKLPDLSESSIRNRLAELLARGMAGIVGYVATTRRELKVWQAVTEKTVP